MNRNCRTASDTIFNLSGSREGGAGSAASDEVMVPSDEELYAKHADELLRFAATLVGLSMAEDVMSGAVLGAFGSPGWPTVRAHRAYLFRAVLNEARQVARSQRRRVLREEAVSLPEVCPPQQVSVDVLDALRRLSLRQRAVVFLTYWMDRSASDVAEELDVSRATVERDLRTAKARLKGMLR